MPNSAHTSISARPSSKPDQATSVTEADAPHRVDPDDREPPGSACDTAPWVHEAVRPLCRGLRDGPPLGGRRASAPDLPSTTSPKLASYGVLDLVCDLGRSTARLGCDSASVTTAAIDVVIEYGDRVAVVPTAMTLPRNRHERRMEGSEDVRTIRGRPHVGHGVAG